MNDFLTLHLLCDNTKIIINKNYIVTTCEYESKEYRRQTTDIVTIKNNIIQVKESIDEIKQQMLCSN